MTATAALGRGTEPPDRHPREDLAPVQGIVPAAYTHYSARVGCEPDSTFDDHAKLIGAKRVHLAERNGVVQGLIVLPPQGEAMLPDNIAVMPNARGSGLGSVCWRSQSMQRVRLAIVQPGLGRKQG